MSRYPVKLVTPVVDGIELITIERLAELTGLSIDRLRERCSQSPKRRGGFIPSYKIGNRRWFNEKQALEAIYKTGYRAEPKEADLDMSFL